MRILHTSDWHLGKRLYKLDRSSEHEAFLSWLISTLIEQKIDALFIAGDVFDTPTPPHQSLQCFYDFLHRVSTETKVETFIIAGNHDSGLLLEAPSRLLSPHRVKVWGKLSENIEDHWITLSKNGETLDLCAIPFFRSYELLPHGEGDALVALKKYLTKKSTSPQLLMMHHLAGMFEAAGSEQVISLSGVDSIPHEIISHFEYVALGHIHKPQKIGPKSHYSGSPIPLRFSETKEKSVVILETGPNGFHIKIHPIPLFRKLITIKATESNWKQKIQDLEGTSLLPPMVEMQLELTAPVPGLLDDIKATLLAKNYELLSFIPVFGEKEKKEKRHEKLFELSPLELFEEFYITKFPEVTHLPEELKKDFMDLLEKVNHAPS